MMEEQQFRFSGTADEFREAVVFLKETGRLGKNEGLATATGNKAVGKGCVIYFTPQADGSVFIVVTGEELSTWDVIRDHLIRRGWVVDSVRPAAYVTTAHPYADPEETTKETHRAVVQLLIDRWMGRNRMTNLEIADAAGISKSQFYEIRNKYTRDMEMRLQQADPD